jgi:hypothetical protein
MALGNSYRVERRRTESFRTDQIVVDLKDEAVLGRELAELGIGVPARDPHEGLGLVRYELDGIEHGLERLDGVTRAQLTERVDRSGGDLYSGVVPTPLDELLFHLRDTFATRHQGWSPRMAKNRMCECVEGAPYSGGAVGEPREAASFRLEPPTEVAGRRVRIGVFDTPLHPHPGLAGRYYAGPGGLLPDDADRVPFAAHALMVCSIAAERAPDAEFVVKPVLDPGTLITTVWELATSMVDGLKDDLDVYVLALGGTTADGQEPLVLARACERTAGVVKVAALGNHGERLEPAAGEPSNPYKPPPNAPMWPAAGSSVIAVGAADDSFAEAPFSPRLEEAPWADVLAVGVGRRGLFLPGLVSMVEVDHKQGVIIRTGIRKDFEDGYATWDGSSFAAADVAGLIAGAAQARGVGAREAAGDLLARRDVTRDPAQGTAQGTAQGPAQRPVRGPVRSPEEAVRVVRHR